MADKYYRSTTITRETRSRGPEPGRPGSGWADRGFQHQQQHQQQPGHPGAPRPHSRAGRRLPDDDIDEFFARNELNPDDSMHHCMEYAQTRLPPNTEVEPSQTQGYCSLTLLAATEPIASVIQFRPESHRLDVALAEDVRAVYGPVAPLTRSLGYLFVPRAQEEQEDEHGSHRRRLRDRIFHRHRDDDDGPRRRLRDRIFHRHRHDDDDDRKQAAGRRQERGGESDQVILHVYSMNMLPGAPLTSHRLARLPPDVAGTHRAALVRSLAQHFSTAWRDGKYPDAPRRPHSTVALSLRGRLEAMAHTLPPRFRASAAQVLSRLPQIEALPWVLTHGDLVPVNVLVDPQRGSISGLIDWAESEYLPFGTGLYGLEELLSHAASLPEEEGPDGRGKRWGYYPDISALRELFWSELLGMVPELREGGMMDTVRLAGQMGVLLWCGIAFDDGKIDRVIQEGRDATEVAKLDLFLLSPQGCKDASVMRLEQEAASNYDEGGHGDHGGAGRRGSRREKEREPENAFMFDKQDDEENVQELKRDNPVRYRL